MVEERLSVHTTFLTVNYMIYTANYVMESRKVQKKGTWLSGKDIGRVEASGGLQEAWDSCRTT